MRWLIDLWHWRQRRIDLMILWPECCKNAADLDQAKAAFAFHVFHDRAWIALGEDEITRRINQLEDHKDAP